MLNSLFKNINSNVSASYLFKIFANNFIKGGLMIGIAITIIELIYQSKDTIQFYAFVSASFFIIQLLQYEYVYKKSKQATIPFIIHSIIGGIFFVLYGILMYYLHKYNVKPSIIVKSLLFLYIIISILYYILIQNKNI